MPGTDPVSFEQGAWWGASGAEGSDGCSVAGEEEAPDLRAGAHGARWAGAAGGGDTAVGDLVREACRALGAGPERAGRWQAALQGEGLESLGQLRGLGPEQWAELSLPVGLEAEMQRLLRARPPEQEQPRRPGGGAPSRAPGTPAQALRALLRRSLGAQWPQQLLRALRSQRRVDQGAFRQALQALGAPRPQPSQVRETLALAGPGGRAPSAEEVVAALHGPLEGLRERAVLDVFRALDADGDGRISGGFLRQQLAALEHPDVKAGRASAEEASRRLLGSWQGAEPVSLPQFLDRHVLLSALWPGGDAEFENSVCRLWQVGAAGCGPVEAAAPPLGLRREAPAAARHRAASAPAHGPAPAQRAAAARRRAVEERLMRSPRAAPLVERLRRACQREGGGAMWLLARALREEASHGPLEVPELLRALREVSVQASAADVTDVLRAVDQRGIGSVGVEELLEALRGPLRPRRAQAVHEAFCALDAGGSGVASLTQLRQAFRPERLPVVEAGWCDAQAAWRDLLHELGGPAPGGDFTEEDFVRYFEFVSVGVLHDSHFSHVARSAFGLDPCADDQRERNRHRAQEGQLHAIGGWLSGGSRQNTFELAPQGRRHTLRR